MLLFLSKLELNDEIWSQSQVDISYYKDMKYQVKLTSTYVPVNFNLQTPPNLQTSLAFEKLERLSLGNAPLKYKLQSRIFGA